jgi:hypothetical protein
MTNEQQLAKLAKQEARRRARRRSHRMAFLSVLVAGFYFFGTDLILNGGDRWHLEWDGLRHTNSVRAVLVTVFPLPSASSAPSPAVGLLSGFGPPPRPGVESTPTPEQREAVHHGLREVAAVEGAAWLWERVMWCLCLLLLAVALLSWITPWGRVFHLLAAIAIIAVTSFSLACLRYLELPDGRGVSLWPLSPDAYAALMEKWAIPHGGGLPPLLPRSYLALAALISTYGWLLIGVFARKIRPHVVMPADTQSDSEP